MSTTDSLPLRDDVASQDAPKPTAGGVLTAARPRRAKAGLWRDLAVLGIKVAVVVAAVALVFTTVYGACRSTDSDMAPMVKDGDLVLFYRLSKDYVVGDLVVLKFDGRAEVRRVVATAGDTVNITEAGLIVNGALQQEPDIYQPTRRYDNELAFPIVVGAGQVFVLGDARDNATDSRIYGLVDEEDTLGTVITLIRRRGF